MAIKCEEYNQVCVLAPAGDFVAENTAEARAAVERHIEQKQIVNFVVDFEKAGFIDSEGLETLLWIKRKAEELFGTLQAYLKIAADAKTADKFSDYTYETYYYKDRNGAVMQGSRLTPASRARWDQRNREVVEVWKEVRDAAKDVLAVLKKHEKLLPEHLKKVREYAAECEKNATVVVK